MSDEIRLERTEVGGQITYVPQGRMMYTITEYKRLQDDRDRWRDLCKLFDDHYICQHCDESVATRLQKCVNPLHKIHDEFWEWESQQDG